MREAGTDLHAILNVVTGGDDDTLRTLAARVAAEPDREVVAFLAEVAHSGRPRFVRSRCLHLLTLIADQAEPDVCRLIVDALRLDPREVT